MLVDATFDAGLVGGVIGVGAAAFGAGGYAVVGCVDLVT